MGKTADGNSQPVPKSLDNLRKWPKGVSGNPNGRPKRPSMSAALKKEFENNPDILRELIAVGIREAKNGDFRYWKEIFDRTDGKVASKVELTENKIDWSALDNEGDTDRPSASAARVRSLPESGQA